MDIREQYDKLFQYCYSRVSSRETAEDITQETFLRFLEHPEYQGKPHEIQYLYTIARNLCVDAYRKKPPDELPEDLPDDHPGEAAWIDRIALRAVLDKLPGTGWYDTAILAGAVKPAGTREALTGNLDGYVYMMRGQLFPLYFRWREWDEEADGPEPYLVFSIRKGN